MKLPRKSDSAAIRQHINDLKAQPWLGQARAWWPDFLFRFDDIDAAARILNCGMLLCRNAALASGVMAIDCASPSVIASTASRWKQHVRLYFRPRTPTQYDSEGVRTPDRFMLGAHCPVPVVMLFDAADVLTRQETQFSNGNLAANPMTGSDCAFLHGIPFKKVYHDTWFEQEDKAEIIFHRHAEVVIPNELDLSALRFVGCRTQAEYETLLHLLEPQAREKWNTKIGLGMKANLHFRRWTFVEEVELTRTKIRFQFNPSSKAPGPFHVEVGIAEDLTGVKYAWKSDGFTANSALELNLLSLTHPEAYTVRLELNGNLAYSNHYRDEGTPF